MSPRPTPAGEGDAAQADPGRWLTLTELAAQTGRRREGVRSWVKRAARAGRVSTRTTNRGELQVWATVGLLAGLDPGPARAGRGGDPVTGRVADPGRDDEAAGPQALVEGLLERAARAEDEVNRWRGEAEEAGQRAARAEGELAAEQRRSADLTATLAAERETARAMLALERARSDRLEAALAEARRPWLARVLEGLRRKGS